MITPSANTAPSATPYNADFYNDQLSGSLCSAQIIVPLVIALLHPRSVVDVGCGVGTWLKAFAEAGVEEYMGLDGDYITADQLLIAPSHFMAADLEHPPRLDRTFDLAVCLEVGEHLPAKSAPNLVATLTATAPCVLFSAALPGQGGTHHVNERWPNYWQRLFAERGFVRLDPIRPQVWRNRSVEWWYKQNIYLYCRKSEIEKNSALREEAILAAECPFELIHTDIINPFTTLRGMARKLLYGTPRSLGRFFQLKR